MNSTDRLPISLTRLSRAAVLLPVALMLAAFAQQSPTNPTPQPGVTSPVVQEFVQQQGHGMGAQPNQPGGKTAQPKTGTATAPTVSHAVRALQSGTKRQVSIKNQEAFEPILNHKVKYGDVPETGQPITLLASTAPIPVIELLDQIATATGWNIIASQGLEGLSVRLWVNEISPKKAMAVLKFNGVHYEFDSENNFLYVMTVDEYLQREYGEIKSAEFKIEHADVQDMESILGSLQSKAGRLVSDPRTGKIFVWDTEENVEAMSRAVKELDVPLQPRVYSLKHLTANDLLESIQSLLSERGLANADPRTNSIVVTDLPGREEQIGKMLEALDQKLDSKTWTLNYADTKTVSERLQNILPEDTKGLTIDEDTHQVSLTDIPSRIEEVDEMIKSWDVKGRQVTIEAYMITASSSVMRNLSINWSYFDTIAGAPIALQSGNAKPDFTSAPDTGQRVTAGRLPYRGFLLDPFTHSPIREISNANGSEAGGLTGNNILSPIFNGNRVAAVIDYLESTGQATILARPRVTVQDGEEAKFENTRDNAYETFGFSNFGVVNNTNNQQNSNVNGITPGSVQFITTGTILKVTPRINEEENILLDIQSEDSTAADKTITAGGLSSTVPEKTQNKATTTVLVNTGQTVVIGGLRYTNLTDNVDKVPVLGDIPFLGRFFKSTKKDHSDRELAVFITCTIVDEYTRPEAERLVKLENKAADGMRNTTKDIWGRIIDRVSKGKNEFAVAVGENGKIYVDGEPSSIDELQSGFDKMREAKLKPTVIIRVHPDAPTAPVGEIKQRAEAAGLKVTVDTTTAPFVPTYRGDTAPPLTNSAPASPAPETVPAQKSESLPAELEIVVDADGTIRYKGAVLRQDDLKKLFDSSSQRATKPEVTLRANAKAPSKVVKAISKAARDAGLKVTVAGWIGHKTESIPEPASKPGS